MNLFAGLLATALLLGAAVYQGVLFHQIAPPARDTEAGLIFLPSPAQARVLSLGYTSIVADYYWVKALQYYTNPANDRLQYKNLPDYLDVVVGIDPDYRYAYKFAGLVVPYDTGRYRFRHTKRSTSFLERGVKRFPDWWELHFLLGYNYLNFANEPVKASEEFKRAAALPGAPAYLHAFSARTLAVGGQLDRAMLLAEELARNSEDPEIRDMMQKRFEDLKLEQELQRIEAGARAYKERHGAFPIGVQTMVDDGFPPSPVPNIKLDPDGTARAPGATRMNALHSVKEHATFGAID